MSNVGRNLNRFLTLSRRGVLGVVEVRRRLTICSRRLSLFLDGRDLAVVEERLVVAVVDLGVV